MNPVHLLIESGPEAGREVSIPSEGIRIGRSSKNDVSITDASISRFHCRFAFKGEDGIWVTDLGASNQTMVNDEPVMEARVRPGDRVAIGDTTVKVISDRVDGHVVPAAESAPPSPAASTGSGHEVELGFKRKSEPSSHRPDQGGKPSGGRIVLWATAGLAILVMLVGVLLMQDSDPVPPPPPPKVIYQPEPETYSIHYTKVDATTENIFRYELDLNEASVLSIQIDDLANSQHIRKSKEVDPDAVRSLLASMDGAGFFRLQPSYAGIQETAHSHSDLSVTIGHRSHRSVVDNRSVEPDDFVTVRDMLEEFGRNQLGLHAVELPKEKLIELAQDATLLGQKLYRERGVSPANLGLAIREFADAEWYVEAIEPKPDFYRDAVSGRKAAEEALNIIYEERMFIANKAIRNRDWASALAELTELTEMFPDRSDRRYKAAYNKLVDTQRNVER